MTSVRLQGCNQENVNPVAIPNQKRNITVLTVVIVSNNVNYQTVWNVNTTDLNQVDVPTVEQLAQMTSSGRILV